MLSKHATEETRGVLKIFLENVIRDSATYTEHARRKTVTARDVVTALKRQGRKDSLWFWWLGLVRVGLCLSVIESINNAMLSLELFNYMHIC